MRERILRFVARATLMMSPILIIFLLVVTAVVLLIAELLIPSHGLLGVLAAIVFGSAIVMCFTINRWVGLIALAGSALASPFIAMGVMALWQRSPVGRRMIMQPLETFVRPPEVHLGQQGTVITELRPMGECVFNEAPVEVASEQGIIVAGTRVKVVAFNDGKPVVRPLA
jgi:membrane-bound serine protease (ClpP class)